MFWFTISWVNMGFLSRPQIFSIATIIVQFSLLIISLHTTKWSMSNFILTTWDSWFKTRLSLLSIEKLMIILLIYLQSQCLQLGLLSYVICSSLRQLQLLGGCPTNVISPPEPLELCLDGGCWSPQVLMVHHNSTRDNWLRIRLTTRDSHSSGRLTTRASRSSSRLATREIFSMDWPTKKLTMCWMNRCSGQLGDSTSRHDSVSFFKIVTTTYCYFLTRSSPFKGSSLDHKTINKGPHGLMMCIKWLLKHLPCILMFWSQCVFLKW